MSCRSTWQRRSRLRPRPDTPSGRHWISISDRMRQTVKSSLRTRIRIVRFFSPNAVNATAGRGEVPCSSTRRRMRPGGQRIRILWRTAPAANGVTTSITHGVPWRGRRAHTLTIGPIRQTAWRSCGRSSAKNRKTAMSMSRCSSAIMKCARKGTTAERCPYLTRTSIRCTSPPTSK